MKKFLLLIGSIFYIMICYFLAMQLAYYLSFNKDLVAMQAANRICFDYRIMWWQGNNNYFKLATIVILTSYIVMVLSLLMPSSSRKSRAAKRGLTKDEKAQYSHLASRHEAKKGLQRFQFNAQAENDDLYNSFSKPMHHMEFIIGNILVIVQLMAVVLLVLDLIEMLIKLAKPEFHIAANTMPWFVYSEIIGGCAGAFTLICRFHIRDYCDLVFNPFKHKWNQWITITKQPDSRKFNELRYQKINDVPDCRRAGLPIITSRRKIWVEPGDNHSLIVGTTNSGKTFSTIMIFIMTVLMANTSAFINDIKGELTPMFAPMFKMKGYNVIVLNFVDSNKSECWNPFSTVYQEYRKEQARTIDNPDAWKDKALMKAYMDAKKDMMHQLVKTISAFEVIKQMNPRDPSRALSMNEATEAVKKKMQVIWNIEDREDFPRPDFSDAHIKLEDICRMLCEDKNAKDEHWWKQAQYLMDGLISFLLEYEYLDEKDNLCRLPEDAISFPNIQALRTDGFTPVDIDGTNRIFLIQWWISMTKRSVDRSAEKLNPICYMGAEERGSVMSTFADKMQIGMISERVKQMTSRTTFSFHDIFVRKTAVFMIVNDEKKLFHPFVSIFVSQLYQEMVDFSRNYPKQRLPIPFDIIWDEFGISPAVGDINSKLAASRYRGVRWHFVIQEYSQLDQTYGKEEARTIKGNIMNTVYLLAETPSTLKEISERAGQQKVWNKEKQCFDTIPVITPDRLQHLSMSEALVLRQRKMPYLTRYLAFDRYVFAKALKKLNDSPYYQADRHGRPISKLQRYTEFSLMADYERMKNPQHSSERNCEVEMHQFEESSLTENAPKRKNDQQTEYDSETGEVIENASCEKENEITSRAGAGKVGQKKSKRSFKAKGSERHLHSGDLQNDEIDIDEDI